MQRLAFIQYLHHLGDQQAHLPEPMRTSSVLTYHDAVELFLVLAGDHLNADLDPRIEFKG
ncbi:hypothetical protein LO762_29775 [Actinocorallia sp. API 0066]|uniref:hypothetical protein n=1 Tax=Actinocorallia sp. API 0066 TaxID=2896846 RepID=UPI001E38EE18|nr:hypothetical protein [Actinocorallia sp. API 0066]MCD0453339.1 hypothetical protein [Actinocorallia sp. API 0066]